MQAQNGQMRTLEKLEKEIRDPAAIWYGPHQCEGCGKVIVRRDRRQGEVLSLDAEDFNHHYPNVIWTEHVCTPSGLPLGEAGGVARAKALPPKRRKEIAVMGGKARPAQRREMHNLLWS